MSNQSSQIISWRIRPVFVSGTFRDMQAERDHLHDVIFPELERRLSERHFHLSAVDLRWGVETISQAEEEKDLFVLKVCLDELRETAFSATGAETRGICLYGRPGSGKSAVFATLYRELHEKNCLVLAHAGGINLRAGSVEAMLRRWIQDIALYLGMEDKDPSEGLSGFDETKNLFAALLSQAAVNTRVICLVDALNQFERSVIARYLTWVPEPLPQNVRLITTAVEGDETAALSKRKDCRLMPLTDMDQSEAADMTHRICEQYHKKIHADIVAKLTGKKLPDNSLAAGNPLWLKLAVEHLLLMDGDDFAEADRLEGTPEQKLHNFMLQMAETFPPEIEKLYDSLFRRASERFGKRQNIAWIPDMLDVIAASRQGLRDRDIQALLSHLVPTLCVGMQPGRSASASDREQAGLDEPERPESRSHAERGNENVSDVSFDFQFALIRRYLRAHLTQRTEQGLWDFTHAQARMSVLNSRLADPAYFKQCHCRMADYLESLPREDPLRITERMYHLIAADEKEKAAQLYGSLMLLLNDAEGKACTKALVENMLRQGEEGWAWVESLLDFARNSQDEKLSHRLCTRFNFDLSDELKYQVTLGPRIRLLEANKSCLEAFCAQFPDNADFARDLSVSYGKIGDLFLQSGKQEIALQYFEKCNTLFEELRTRTPDSADFARNFAVSHYKLAGYYQEKEEYERMLEHFQKFLDIGHEMEERGMFVDAPLKRAMEQIRAALAQISEL